jgi:hypothetical protein
MYKLVCKKNLHRRYFFIFALDFEAKVRNNMRVFELFGRINRRVKSFHALHIIFPVAARYQLLDCDHFTSLNDKPKIDSAISSFFDEFSTKPILCYLLVL